MPNPFCLLHLSDIHFGAEDRLALQSVTEFARSMRPDAVVVAGDITQGGRRREFEAARRWLDGLGLETIVAPGNHDTPAYNFPQRMLAPFDRYAQYIGDYNVVGRVVELAGGQVRVAAINTARGIQGRINWADGVIDIDDLEAALNGLAEGPETAWRILVCHHPLHEPSHSRIAVDTRRGGQALQRCAAAHVDAILTGHIHDAFAHALHSPRRQMVQMGSGTLSTRLRSTLPSFCVVRLDGEKIIQEIVTLNRDGLRVEVNYDSSLHQPGLLRQRREGS
ncbi:MAG: metallophosphoesterase [Hyphomonadaceae bacterium]